MLKLSGPTHCFTAVAAASLISKPFRVAFAGETVDGREIKEEWLRDIADTYSPEKYTAEVWPEHWRSLSPGGDFKSQGSIASVFVQEDTVDGEKALALYATIVPNASLIEMNRRGEKKYSSIEVTENFRGSGKAYLTGMAVTDSPASIGTQALQFSANQLQKQISDSIETTLEFTENTPPEQSVFNQIMAKLNGMFSKQGKNTDTRFTELAQVVEQMGQVFMDEQKAYVAMTRAQKHLYMTHGEDSYFADKLNQAIENTTSI